AWRFLSRQGIAPDRIVVGGDSAGGNLTLCLVNILCAAGERLPRCLWLVSPWTDLSMAGATLSTKDAIDPIIHRAYLEELATAYVPHGVGRRDP
ncbi:MAG: alpha/beta hydrolase, partial [Mesorhizobium sp.]